MIVIIDEREHAIYEKCLDLLKKSPNQNIVLFKQVLELGDMIIKTNDDEIICIIERKTFTDLLSSVKDGRYEEQSYRLLHSSGVPPHSIIYLLEGFTSTIRTPVEKKIIQSSITSMSLFKGFSIQRTSNALDTAEWLIHTTDKIHRNLEKGLVVYHKTLPYSRSIMTNSDLSGNICVAQPQEQNYCNVVKKTKKDNITENNIGEIILSQIPGISSVTAIAIMNQFNSFPHLVRELNNDPTCIENLTITTNGKTRKINKNSIENIKRFLLESKSSDNL
jgi:ERCC4-type nuclease